jgi:xanthine dehydrogenase FAD-binding subunit
LPSAWQALCLCGLNAEAFINGREVTLENIQQFGRTVLEDIHPRDSWRASKAFRSHIAVESAKRCLMESVKLAGGEL